MRAHTVILGAGATMAAIPNGFVCMEVGMGYCEEHREFGTKDAVCPVCKKQLPPTRLLYPVKNKEYNKDDYVAGCWDAINYIINNSYMITIFGYSAPSSDTEAVNLLKKLGEKRKIDN